MALSEHFWGSAADAVVLESWQSFACRCSRVTAKSDGAVGMVPIGVVPIDQYGPHWHGTHWHGATIDSEQGSCLTGKLRSVITVRHAWGIVMSSENNKWSWAWGCQSLHTPRLKLPYNASQSMPLCCSRSLLTVHCDHHRGAHLT